MYILKAQLFILALLPFLSQGAKTFTFTQEVTNYQVNYVSSDDYQEFSYAIEQALQKNRALITNNRCTFGQTRAGTYMFECWRYLKNIISRLDVECEQHRYVCTVKPILKEGKVIGQQEFTFREVRTPHDSDGVVVYLSKSESARVDIYPFQSAIASASKDIDGPFMYHFVEPGSKVNRMKAEPYFFRKSRKDRPHSLHVSCDTEKQCSISLVKQNGVRRLFS